LFFLTRFYSGCLSGTEADPEVVISDEDYAEKCNMKVKRSGR